MEIFGVTFSLWTILQTVLILIVLSFFFEWVQFLVWRRKYKLDSVFPIPLIGTSLPMFTQESTVLDENNAKRFGKVSCGYLGSLRMVTIHDAELLKKVLIKENASFINRFSFNLDPYPINHTLLNLKSANWKRVRSCLTPTFSAGKLKKMIPEVNYCTRLLLDGLVKKAKSGEVVETKKHVGCFTMDVIAGTAFGIRTDSYNNPDDPFVDLAQKVFGQPSLGPAVLFAIFFPNLTKLIISLTNTSVYFPLDSVKFFCDVIKKIIKEREEKNDTERVDLLQLMLNASLEVDGQSKKLTEDEMLAQGFIVFVAGYETTATLMTFLSYVLAMHPEVQEKLIEEVDKHIPEDVVDVTYDQVMELPYLEQVINETLRMYPPVCRMDRTTSGDDVQVDGIWLPSNIPLGFSIWHMHHNEKFYPDPYVFRPERFTGEEKANRDPFVFMPFGHGPRNCLGMRLALLEVKIAVVGLMRKLRFVKCAETEEHLKLDVQVFTRPMTPIKVKVELR